MPTNESSLKNYTLTYRNPTLADANARWVENFEDKFGRLARAQGPFNYMIFRNKSGQEVTIELNQDPNVIIVVPAGDAFADNVQPFSGFRVVPAGAIAADLLIFVPKRVGVPGGIAVGS